MSSRPSAARRRVHRDRVIAKRLAQARQMWWVDHESILPGRLANEQWYLGCHCAKCGVCHPGKNCSNGDRQREEREWRRIESRAWDE